MARTEPALRFLDFEYSEDAQGFGALEAMASVRPGQLIAARADLAQVLDWAHAAFPGMQAALDEGGEWDFDLQEQQEVSAGTSWHTLTLSISGSPQFCAAFRQRFSSEAWAPMPEASPGRERP